MTWSSCARSSLLSALSARVNCWSRALRRASTVASPARVSDKTAFFFLGELVEYDETKIMFTNPKDSRTQNYITGRFS